MNRFKIVTNGGVTKIFGYLIAINNNGTERGCWSLGLSALAWEGGHIEHMYSGILSRWDGVEEERVKRKFNSFF